jgi:hypothetical protein
MDNNQSADKRQFSEILTKRLDKVMKKCDKESEVYTTEGLDLWTAEMLEEYTHDEVCLDHLHNMQSATGSWFDELPQMFKYVFSPGGISPSDIGAVWRVGEALDLQTAVVRG